MRFLRFAFLACLLAACSIESEAARDRGNNGADPDQQGNRAFDNAEGAASWRSADGGSTCPPGSDCQLDAAGCRVVTFRPHTREVPQLANLLVVFDRSGSTQHKVDGVPKYEIAGRALLDAIAPFQDLLTVGAVLFPSFEPPRPECICDFDNPRDFQTFGCCTLNTVGTCEVNGFDAPDQISFRDVASFSEALPRVWRINGVGGTALERGTERAAEILATTKLIGPTAVLFVSEADANCEYHERNILDRVALWALAGIQTHTFGSPIGADAPRLLAKIASITGTETNIPWSDVDGLQSLLKSLTTTTVNGGFESCSFAIEPAAAAPADLELEVVANGGAVVLPNDSWSINTGEVSVSLNESYCDDALSGRFDALTVRFGCPGFSQPDVQ